MCVGVVGGSVDVVEVVRIRFSVFFCLLSEYIVSKWYVFDNPFCLLSVYQVYRIGIDFHSIPQHYYCNNNHNHNNHNHNKIII